MDRTATRLAGAVLVVGTAIMLVGAALPLLTGLGLEAWTADWDRKLDVVIGNSTAWRVANGLIIFGAVVTVVGIALVANLLRDLNRPSEAAAAVALFPVGVALEAVSRTANMTTTVWAAEAKAAGDTSYRLFEVIDQWRALMGDLFLILASVALVVIGFGFQRTGQVALGLLGLFFGGIALLLAAVSALFPAVVFLGTGALGAALLLTTSPDP